MEPGKCFVGGVSPETTEETLKEHFGKYGEVKEAEVIRDRNTGKGRGFSFVKFEELSVADKVRQEEHIIHGRTVQVSPAEPRNGNNGSRRNNSDGNGNMPLNPKKIFVGGLPRSLTEEEFKNYFESFGTITDAVVLYDKESNRSRGFGFITFDSEEAADNVLQNKFHQLKDKLVEVKRAEPKNRSSRRRVASEHENLDMRRCDCCNTRLGFERLSVLGSGEVPVPYVRRLPYESVAYYYGADFPTGRYNGVAAEVPLSSYYPNPIPYGYPSFYPTYINGGCYSNGWASGQVNVTDADGNNQANAVSHLNNNSDVNPISYGSPVFYPMYFNGGGYSNGWASDQVNVTDGDGSNQGNAVSNLNNDSNENDGNPVLDTTYITGGGYSNGWASGQVNVTDVEGSNQGNAVSDLKNNSNENDGNRVFDTTYINGGGYSNGWASGQVNVTDGDGSNQGNAVSVLNNSSNENNGGGDAEAPACTILPQADGALCPESSDAEHRNGADCHPMPCKSS